jgi:hypothetical protein
MEWLVPAGKPLLVQLTSDEYVRLQREWHLPFIPGA